MVKKRILITTASFSKTNKPVIFLGNWCANYINISIRKNLDYVVYKNNLFSYKNSKDLIKKSNYIYESILDDLYKKLNSIHNINWSKRSWRIVIGPWLYRYVSIFLRSIKLIKEIKKYKKIKVTVDKKISLHFQTNLQSYDLWDFTNRIYKEDYNSALFTASISKVFNFNKIYNNLSNINSLRPNLNKYYGKLSNHKANYKSIRNNYFDHLSSKLFFFIERLLCFLNKIIFYKIYYGNKLSLLKIFFKLREIPFKYNLKEHRIKYAFKKKIRNKLDLKKININFEEKIIRDFLKITVPSIYLEGFKDVIMRLKNQPFPKERKLIFSCNIHYDYLFKFWAAIQINNGSKLVYGQHGGGYDLFENDFRVEHESTISDLFLSWGWKSSNANVMPLGCFSTIGKKKYKLINNKKYLLVLRENYHYFTLNDLIQLNDLYMGSKDYVLKSTKFIIDFITLLKKNKINIHLRSHPNEIRQSVPIKSIIDIKFKDIIYNTGNLLKNLNNYELAIFSTFEHTTLLQCLTLDKPFIAFVPTDMKVINQKYHKSFFKLISAGVFHLTPDSAMKFILKNQQNVSTWWKSKKVKKAISSFSRDYINKCEDKFLEKKIYSILHREKYNENI